MGVRPSIKWDEFNQWSVTSEEHWMPTMAVDLPFADSNLIWVAPPRPELPGPVILYEMMDEALDFVDYSEDDSSGH
jgi:hypothetical protein